MLTGKRIGGIVVTVAADTTKFARGMKLSQRLLGTFTRLAKGAAIAGMTALAAGVGKAAMRYEELNRTMNRSLSIMGNVSKAMRDKLTNAAIAVAKTTVFSARQAGEAYFFLASAGLDAEQSLAAMPKVAKFAQAGNFDLALATDLLTDAQSALGLSSKNAAENMTGMVRVSDVLVKANTLANSSVQQFSEALTNKAGAALRLLGKDVEEGVAVLAAYADQGVKGAEAGTAFGIVLRDLQTKSLQNAGQFKKMKIAVFDSAGEMRNIADIISDVETRLNGMSDAQKKTTLLQLGFSDKSVAYVQSLVGVSDKIRDYEKALRSAGGTTNDVASKMMTPMEKALSRLGASFDKFAQTLGPAVNKIADILSGLADIIDNMDTLTEHPGFKAARILAFGPSLGDLKNAVGGSGGAAKAGLPTPTTTAAAPLPTVALPTAAKTPVAQARSEDARRTAAFNTMFRGPLADSLGSAIGDAIKPIVNTARDFGGQAFGGLVAGRNAAFKGMLLAPFAAGNALAAAGSMPQRAPRNTLAFAESGSAESYRQRARIRGNNDADKVRKQQLKQLEMIAKNTAKKNDQQLMAANL